MDYTVNNTHIHT